LQLATAFFSITTGSIIIEAFFSGSVSLLYFSYCSFLIFTKVLKKKKNWTLKYLYYSKLIIAILYLHKKYDNQLWLHVWSDRNKWTGKALSNVIDVTAFNTDIKWKFKIIDIAWDLKNHKTWFLSKVGLIPQKKIIRFNSRTFFQSIFKL